MNFISGRLFSFAALTLTALVYLILGWVYQPWNHKGVIQHDAVSYYSYLPSVFIYRDLSLAYIDQPENSEARKCLMFKVTSDNKRYLKMTMGVSMLQLPFFLTAHGYSHATGKSTSGFSAAYELAIWAAAFFLQFSRFDAAGSRDPVFLFRHHRCIHRYGSRTGYQSARLCRLSAGHESCL